MESTVNNKEEITGVLISYSDGGAGVEDALAANELLYPVDSIVCIIFLPKVMRQFETWSTKRIGRTSRRIADHGGAQYLRERERETARRQEEVDRRREETSRRWDTMAKKKLPEKWCRPRVRHCSALRHLRGRRKWPTQRAKRAAGLNSRPDSE